MNIGIDLDGVLFDSEAMFRSYSQIFDILNYGGGMINSEELKVQNRYGWVKELTEKFINETAIEYHQTASVMPFAKQVINAIKKHNKVFVITSRGLVHKKEVETTEKRLLAENFEFDNIIYSVENKLDACRELDIDIMIDDLYEHVDLLSENGIKCFYYRDMVLKFFNKENVVEVRNWGDIAAELLKLKVITIEDLKCAFEK